MNNVLFIESIIYMLLGNLTVSKNLVINFAMPKITSFANPPLQTVNFIQNCKHFIKVNQVKYFSEH